MQLHTAPLPDLDSISFFHHWNNKTDCDAYTTIRLSGRKYQVGKRFNVYLQKRFIHVAEVLAVKEMYLHQLNEFIARIDTGYSVEECREIIIKMYPRLDMHKQPLQLVLLKRVKIIAA